MTCEVDLERKRTNSQQLKVTCSSSLAAFMWMSFGSIFFTGFLFQIHESNKREVNWLILKDSFKNDFL